ncbi:hypothetical protein [Mesorhizobium sp. WSM1497]|uniref:hypothetical protein n=1 Tax=Mesorhizobium sp. WSM1497 TaxID=278153 RepID=UPI000A32081E|nr:hypothetical protein [Mesorhizobium sp. WSM1497]
MAGRHDGLVCSMDWPASPSGTAIAIDSGMLIQSAALFKAKVLSLKSCGVRCVVDMVRPAGTDTRERW